MVQGLFFLLFIMSIIVGIFVYFKPAQNTMDPLRAVMQGSGYDTLQVKNDARMQEYNVTTDAGLVKIHRQMDLLATQQSEFIQTVQDQQRILENTDHEIADIMDQLDGKDGKDVLQLKALALQLQDQQRLLVSRGKDLIALNDQVTRNREMIAEQMSMADVNNKSTLSTLSERYDLLQEQAKGLFHQGTSYSSQVQGQMFKMQGQLNGLVNNSSYDNTMGQKAARDRTQDVLQEEHQKSLNSPSSDSQQQTQDIIDQERQKEQEQEEVLKQRIADEKQRAEDQQNH